MHRGQVRQHFWVLEPNKIVMLPYYNTFAADRTLLRMTGFTPPIGSIQVLCWNLAIRGLPVVILYIYSMPTLSKYVASGLHKCCIAFHVYERFIIYRLHVMLLSGCCCCCCILKSNLFQCSVRVCLPFWGHKRLLSLVVLPFQEVYLPAKEIKFKPAESV